MILRNCNRTRLTLSYQWHWSNLADKPASLIRYSTNHFTAQYNAWCLNNGVHETLKRGHENWNAKIIWKMRMELEGQWDLVEEEVSDVFAALLNDVKSLLDSFKSSLYGEFVLWNCLKPGGVADNNYLDRFAPAAARRAYRRKCYSTDRKP
jgi:hypothetical protein